MQTYRRKKIETICEDIWNTHNLVPGFDFSPLLNSLSIQLNYEDLSDDISAVLVIKGSKKVITLNKNNNKARQRFSACHEIGHLLLEHKKNFDISEKELIQYRNVKSSEGTDIDEIEANYFAANLLMPNHEIQKHVDFSKSFDSNVESISEKFQVSFAAATLRLNYLGYQ